MKCEEFAELLPDYLQESVSRKQLGAIEEHLKQCGECREQIDLWRKLGSLPEEQPTPVLRQNFDAMLEAYRRGEWEQEIDGPSPVKPWTMRTMTKTPWFASAWLRSPLAQAAFAAVLLVAGFVAGRYETPHGPNSNDQELAALHKELTSTRQMVALSLLQQQSASDRLQGVNWSMRASRPDPEILAALLQTLQSDSAVDVRLAALDALKRYNDRPEVRTGLVNSLQRQQSPLVQIALIDLLVELREAGAVENLKQFEQKRDLNPSVREHAEWGINQLSRG